MDIIKYAILGMVQGITEFLPVSSSGHLAIAHRLVGIEADLGFDTMVHLGTALAVVIFYFKDLLVYAVDIFSSAFRTKGRKNDWNSVGGARLFALIALTSVPAAVAGVILKDKVEAAFSSALAVSAFLAVTGVVLVLVSGHKGGHIDSPGKMPWSAAAFIGLAQAFALFPGVSRSGMTIAAGIAAGLTSGWAVDYSMMASLPVIVGAFLLQMADGGIAFSSGTGAGALTGGAVAAVTGFLAIALIRKVARSRSFIPFAIWVFIIAVANAALYIVKGI